MKKTIFPALLCALAFSGGNGAFAQAVPGTYEYHIHGANCKWLAGEVEYSEMGIRAISDGVSISCPLYRVDPYRLAIQVSGHGDCVYIRQEMDGSIRRMPLLSATEFNEEVMSKSMECSLNAGQLWEILNKTRETTIGFRK